MSNNYLVLCKNCKKTLTYYSLISFLLLIFTPVTIFAEHLRLTIVNYTNEEIRKIKVYAYNASGGSKTRVDTFKNIKVGDYRSRSANNDTRYQLQVGLTAAPWEYTVFDMLYVKNAASSNPDETILDAWKACQVSNQGSAFAEWYLSGTWESGKPYNGIISTFYCYPNG